MKKYVPFLFIIASTAYGGLQCPRLFKSLYEKVLGPKDPIVEINIDANTMKIGPSLFVPRSVLNEVLELQRQGLVPANNVQFGIELRARTVEDPPDSRHYRLPTEKELGAKKIKFSIDLAFDALVQLADWDAGNYVIGGPSIGGKEYVPTLLQAKEEAKDGNLEEAHRLGVEAFNMRAKAMQAELPRMNREKIERIRQWLVRQRP